MINNAVKEGHPGEKVTLSRDALGINQTYYSLLEDGRLFYSDDINSLADCPEIPGEIDDWSVYQYLSFRNTISPHTIYKNIYSLRPGEEIIYENGRLSRQKKKNCFGFDEVDITSDKAAAHLQGSVTKQISQILNDSMDEILESAGDKELRCFLSGGLDSSVTAALAAVKGARFTAFTLDMKGGAAKFHDKEADVNAAKLLCDKYGIKQEIVSMEPADLIDNLGQMLKDMGEPFSGTFSTWILAREAAKSADIILTGDGADEVFAGYEPYKLAGSEGLSEIIGKMILMGDESKEMFLGERLIPFAKEKATSSFIDVRIDELCAHDDLNRLLEFDAGILLPDHVLRYASNFSRAHSVSLKSPFLNENLFRYMARLSGDTKMPGKVTKALLRKAAKDILPPDILQRKKEGFIMPIEDWMASGKRLKEFVTDILSPVSLIGQDYLNPVSVQVLLKKYYDDPLNNPIFARIIWNFTCLVVWLNGQ